MAGYKTYLVAVAMVAYALLGYALGYMEFDATGRLVLEALGLVGLRLGIAKVVNTQQGPNNQQGPQ